MSKKNKRKAAWVAVLTSFALILSVDSAYSRLIDWTSAEFVYTPADMTQYSSDCLIPGGQQILLSDWQMDETERTVTIAIRRPAPTVSTEVTEIPQETTLPAETVIPEASETTVPETTVPSIPETTVPETTLPAETETTVPETTNTTEPETADETVPEATEGEAAAVDLELTEEETTTPTEEPTQETTEATEETAPDPTEETTLPTEETEESTEATVESTEATEDTAVSTEETNLESAETVIPEETWDPSEVTVTMDETATQHLSYEVQVREDTIQLLLKRSETAAGLQQAALATIHVEWNGLEGTFCINILPYGAAVIDDAQGEDTTQPSVVTGLEQVSASGVMDPTSAKTCIKLNLETLADFTLTFFKGSDTLSMVRWSLDGENYSMLYDSNQLTFAWPYTDGWDGTVFLDFSLALEEHQIPSIHVEATDYDPVTIVPVLRALPEIPQSVIKTVQLPWIWEMVADWGEAKIALQSIQRLTADEEGNLVYVDDASLIATVTEDGILLEPVQDEIYPASGSYRMTVQWIWNETAIEEQIIYFFINTN